MASVDDQELLELSGESTLDAVKELTLRGRKLTSFEPYASKVPLLQALSLSHNQLTSLAGFSQLYALVTLNVNSNMLTSLHGLEACVSLQQLYAANNRLRDLHPVAELIGLQTLHMFNNAISSLDNCIRVLSGLSALRDIDLGGNPASQVPDYKHHMVAQLPGLEALDGDALTQLDREMADEFYQKNSQAADGATGSAQVLVLDGAEEPVGDMPADADDAAPATNGVSNPASCEPEVPTAAAPASSCQPHSATATDLQHAGSSDSSATAGPGPGSSTSQQPSSISQPPSRPPSGMRAGASLLEPGRPGTAARPGSALRPGTAGMARPGTPGGFTSQVCSDELLNDNPVLLEYLAKHVLSEGLAAAQQGSGLIPTGSKLRASFAQRLRSTATVMSTTEGMAAEQLVGSSALQHVAAGGSNLAAVREVVSSATPQELIRQLVRLAEVLIKEVESARQSNGSSSSRGNSRPGTASSLPSNPQLARGSSRPSSSSSERPQSSNSGTGPAAPTSAAVVGGISNGSAGHTTGGDVGVSGAGVDAGEVGALRSEVERLRRELKLLQVENANMYWLADEVKRLKGELARAQAQAGAGCGSGAAQ